MFDPKVNPYVEAIKEHEDVIWQSKKDQKFDFGFFSDQNKKVILDLGCGAGNFLRDYAKNCPEYNFIGFELRFKRLVKGALKFKKWNIDNSKLVQGRAEEIGCWFEPSTIKEININFPDPWAKKRQKKHRLITLDYMKEMHNVLEPGGNFVFKTDHREYFFTVVELLKQQVDFKLMEYSEDLHNSEYNEKNIPTEFEGLFKSQGCPVYYLKTVAC